MWEKQRLNLGDPPTDDLLKRSSVERWPAVTSHTMKEPRPLRNPELPPGIDSAELLFLEADCWHRGKKAASRRAYIARRAAAGYFSPSGPDDARGVITTWHGDTLGPARITARWPIRSSSCRPVILGQMLQVEAAINGRRYTGRCTVGRTRASLTGGSYWVGRRRRAPAKSPMEQLPLL